MIKKLYATIIVAIFTCSFAVAQSGTLKGKAIDETTGEGIAFANVQIEQHGDAVGRALADINGEFTIKPIPPGVYDVKVASLGYQTYYMKGVIISGDKTTQIDIKVKSTAIEKDAVVITEYVKPLIDPDTKSGGTITREEFKEMPSKNINSVASTTAGVFQQDEGGDLNVRGARSKVMDTRDFTGTAYYIDGQKVRGTFDLPQSSIEQVSVTTGGVPAQYGDATGGIVNITTRGGMRNDYFGGVELISSQLTDDYGYNYAGFNVGGPVITKKDSTGFKQAKLGFFISGEASSEKDPDPSAVGIYKVKDDKLKQLEEKPLRLAESGTGTNLNAEFLTMDDLEHLKAKQNVGKNVARIDGKIDFKASKNITLTVGGSMDYDDHRVFTLEYALINPNQNPQNINSTMRAYAKITHKLGRERSRDDKSTPLISNAYYTLQVGYSKYLETQQDAVQKNNLFNYGYVGKFETKKAPTFTAVTDSAGKILYYDQTAIADTQVLFTRGTQNPLEANYTSQYYDLVPGDPNTLSDITNGYGLINGDRPRSVYSIWYNTGRTANQYYNLNTSQIRGTGQFSADIKNHSIQIGFEYEQRDDKYWTGNPIGMWGLMRQFANKHITQLDTASDYLYNGSTIMVGTQLVNIGSTKAYIHPYIVNLKEQSNFDRSLRKRLGKGNNEWIDIDSYDPSTFSMSMFSPDELINNATLGNTITYYGYSYDGKLQNGKHAFDLAALEKYYKGYDNNGNFARVVPSFQPIYISGYIQDKFDFKDMKFNVGLRVDHFDANQPQLKDPYLFYEANTIASDKKFQHPTNIPSSSVVYVDDFKNPTKVLGYRNGDTWYNASGVPISDPQLITPATGVIQPYLKYPNENFLESSKVSNVFTMYKAQNTFMPRVAFSFPISDKANFFAHYDVLTQRPPAYLRFDPSNYLFPQTVATSFNNPALKPERTTDYELGFSQVLNERKNAALTISAFYREMRDMIQEIALRGAYPVKYTTFGNLDFGTVKGFTVAYDLRRTNNVRLNASYTLQFAEGTGSSATAAKGAINSGSDQPNLRTIMPLDFDQRHAIVINADYRFGEGKDYNGPQANWAKMILQNFGGNLVFRAGSGLPYTRQKNVTSGNGDNTSAVVFGMNQRSYLKGKINGSNMPWQYRADVRIDKNITLIWKKADGDNQAKSSNLNVYVQILNVLNTKNVINLYRYTGDPKDDGYLSAPENQNLITAATDPQSYVDLYNAKIANPSHYSIPRRIRIGIALDF